MTTPYNHLFIIDQQVALETKRAELRAALRNRDVLQVERYPDPADNVWSEAQRDTAVGLLERERKLLLAVQDALCRIAEGVYGRCVECGGWIPPKRLEALPWADKCLPCAELADREVRAEVGA